MKKNSLWIAIMASCVSSNVLACSVCFQQTGWAWVSTFSAGPIFSVSTKNDNIYLTDSIEKSYVGGSNRNNSVFGNGEFFFGIQQRVPDTLFKNAQTQLGLNVGVTSPMSVSGTIWDDGDPDFPNYTYNYKNLHSYLAAKGKLLLNDDMWAIPWISASVGLAFNHAYSYSSTPLFEEARYTPDFTSHFNLGFTYSVGIGFQRVLNDNWQMGLGYEFADRGESKLGQAPYQTLNMGVASEHFYTHGLLFNFTYIA